MIEHLKENWAYWLLGAVGAFIVIVTVQMYCQGKDWQLLFTSGILLFAVAIVAIGQLKHAYHTRCAELLLNIMRWWNSDEIADSRLLIWNMKNKKDEILKLYKAKKEDFVKVLKVAEFGECLGVLVARKYVDKRDIWSLFEHDWEKQYQNFSGMIDEVKQKDPLDTTLCNLKLLYEELDKIKH